MIRSFIEWLLVIPLVLVCFFIVMLFIFALISPAMNWDKQKVNEKLQNRVYKGDTKRAKLNRAWEITYWIWIPTLLIALGIRYLWELFNLSF